MTGCAGLKTRLRPAEVSEATEPKRITEPVSEALHYSNRLFLMDLVEIL